MPNKMTINNFEVSFDPLGHPKWVEIKHKGVTVMTALHHSELRDLEYALFRIRAKISASLPDHYKHEV